jgi:hypothetical protein
MFIQGQGDVHYQEHVTMAYELLQKRVDLRDRVWIYEIKNLIHGTRDTIYDTTTPWEGDRLGCFVSAAIGNLREFIEDGRRPPLSRIAGRIVAGELRFDQAGGTTTDKVPVPNDPALDSVVADVNLTPWTIGSGETARWREVTYALPHEDAITGPTVSCRLGGYKLMTFGYQLLPFPSSELTARYRTFERYRDCVHHAVESQDGLAKQRLYDPQVETASETAERARILFDSAAAPHATSEPDRDTEVLTSG